MRLVQKRETRPGLGLYRQAIVTDDIAREAGVKRVVYLSVIHSDVYVDVPHFAGKFGVERMIEQMGLPRIAA